MVRVGKGRVIAASQIVVATLAAAVVVWLWALPVLAFVEYMYSPSHPPTDAQVIRRLWRLPLVPPEWLGRPSDHSSQLLARWELTETLVRTCVVLTLWAIVVAWIYSRYRMLRSRPT